MTASSDIPEIVRHRARTLRAMGYTPDGIVQELASYGMTATIDDVEFLVRNVKPAQGRKTLITRPRVSRS